MTTSSRLLRSELESRGVEITTSAEHDGGRRPMSRRRTQRRLRTTLIYVLKPISAG